MRRGGIGVCGHCRDEACAAAWLRGSRTGVAAEHVAQVRERYDLDAGGKRKRAAPTNFATSPRPIVT
jgi:hypothetical protein